MMDAAKVLSTLSKTFQSDKLCITDMFTTLDTTHSEDTQINYRHSQTVSKFVDVHSRNLIHVSGTNKELKYFL